MNINLNPNVGTERILTSTNKSTPAEAQSNFANTLNGAIEKLNEAQNKSDQMTNMLAAGQVKDLHNVMITAQKASITLEMTVQVQQKVIDAYNEVMRMQV